MKKQTLLLATIATLLVACGGESTENANNANTEETIEEVLPVVSDYQLNAETSTAEWERTLDQKPTKQKVKLFGKMVDVDLGAVKLNSNGSVAIKEGGLTTTNDVLTKVTVVFDMASFKFTKEKGSGLFDVTQHPNSTMVLTNIVDSTANGNLTIQGASNDMNVQIATTKTENSYTLTGSFVVNTLDFPLREKVKEKDINKDEIKVTFELVYGK
ncbi:MAG: YceI family protein [Vicingaceae bacterium]|nr:YceI family protein [Vicingaceae bacterium]